MPTIGLEHACDDKSFKLNLKNPRSTPTQEKQNCCEDLNLKIQGNPQRARARAPTDRTDSTRRSHVQIQL